jgi:hypothetical protein
VGVAGGLAVDALATGLLLLPRPKSSFSESDSDDSSFFDGFTSLVAAFFDADTAATTCFFGVGAAGVAGFFDADFLLPPLHAAVDLIIFPFFFGVVAETESESSLSFAESSSSSDDDDV